MVNVIKDDRNWEINLKLQNADCPYLYYPANYYGCEFLGEDECTWENCPFKISGSLLYMSKEVPNE